MENDIVADIIAVFNKLLQQYGGAAGVISLIGTVVYNITKNKAYEDYKLKINKELAQYKKKLDNKNYVSKIRFDAEFETYRKLSKLYFNMVKSVSIMIPDGIAVYPHKDAVKHQEKQYYDAKEKTALAQDCLYENAPFVDKKIYLKLEQLMLDCRKQLVAFEIAYDLAKRNNKKEIIFDRKDYQLTSKIRKENDEVFDEIRDYLASLEIMD